MIINKDKCEVVQQWWNDPYQ